jgi:hypothetical protein
MRNLYALQPCCACLLGSSVLAGVQSLALAVRRQHMLPAGKPLQHGWRYAA